MKAVILDGRKLSEKILNKIKKEIKNRHLKLTLAVILVGENPVSKMYVSKKQKACEKVGINFKLFRFSARISSQKLKLEIRKITKNKKISGIIVQLPLPKKINSQEILNLIPVKKDVDVLSEKNTLTRQGLVKVLPPVVSGINHFLKEYRISLKGKNIVIVGAGKLVGKPASEWFFSKKVRVSAVDKSTKNIPSLTKKADIIITGVGKPNLIKGDMVKKGVVIVDAGTSFYKGKLTGDVDFKSISKKAKYITPVPGGVGPMTVACLIENLLVINKPSLVKTKTGK